MHPNTFLKTFWQLQMKPQIFVAMSFADTYSNRFENVYKPVISSISWNGTYLSAHRVDLSKSGDSILTDIMDGIAHSIMILADVSTVGKDSTTGLAYRNGNVMYEVGVALACRQSSDVLLLRDDKDKFLFDVTTIPHKHIDFGDVEAAKISLKEELIARLREQQFLHDARVQMALTRLSEQEIKILVQAVEVPRDQSFGFDVGGASSLVSTYEFGIVRLLDKQLIVLSSYLANGVPTYQLTPLGRVVAEQVKSNRPTNQTS